MCRELATTDCVLEGSQLAPSNEQMPCSLVLACFLQAVKAVEIAIPHGPQCIRSSTLPPIFEPSTWVAAERC